MIGIIYKAQNEQTGEIYIGATTNSLYQRKLDQCERAKRGVKGKFHEAISTYGTDAFSWEQIDSASSIGELAQKEKAFILKYNSKEEGYNQDNGGSGIKRTVYKYDIANGLLIEKYECLEKAAKSVSSSKQHISRACLSVNNIYKGFYWSYNYPFEPNEDARKRKVIYYNFKDETAREFDSVAEASRKTGVSKSCIARFCRKERNPPEGILWEYE
ncbi:NUMOD1 domain-containing DNA-binding protein [Aestuariivivens sediminis]|uniref:NUMOD1 domain-containing DNA-binding protein n=1 Tax=Aestuariivivens sediminis TaxID=2913557 RepID=UPI001F594944|nr:NUMOD1 domain-containing DNA-binding protein [Aestuariivivens sediminis]